jgi:cation transport regulator
MKTLVPYPSNDALPPSVREHLPPHAQDIFREAFNHAFERYAGDESTAFRIAWAAVKRSYEKVDGVWVPRSGGW